MADLNITSLRGGLNDAEPLSMLRPDQCTEALNVEFVKSALGERRGGTTAISLSGSTLTNQPYPVILFRHLPTADETAAQLWCATANLGGAGFVLNYKDTSWHAVSVSDTPDTAVKSMLNMRMVSLHGKLFWAYKSGVDRLHVFDGTNMQRAGLATPAAPTGANDGGVGTFSGTRYYRVRYTRQLAGTTLVRSEPSAVLTFAPNGNDTGIVVTKPATISENETHWELEASTDNATFYRIATTLVATTTVTDTTAYSIGYNTASNTQSETIGNYTVPWSAKYLVVDADRLVMAGSHNIAAYGSRVGWTPVGLDPGVGSDERIPTATSNTRDLDALEGGDITGLAQPANGIIYIFKLARIYTMTRNEVGASNAYAFKLLTTARGAVNGSVIKGVDSRGFPCIYFLDPHVGPCRLGVNGLEAWKDIRPPNGTWRRFNINATQMLSCGLYYPDSRQVHWWVTIDSNNSPTMKIVVHVDDVRSTDDGLTGGLALANGDIAAAFCCCMFASNIDDNAARTITLRPFIGKSTGSVPSIHRCDTGSTDNGTAYSATLTTALQGLSLTKKFGIRAGTLMAGAASGVTVEITLIRDTGLESSAARTVNLSAAGAEQYVFKEIDDLTLSELHAVQVKFADPASPTGQWRLQALALLPAPEESQ